MRGVAAAEEGVEGCEVGSVGAQRMQLFVVLDRLRQVSEMYRGFDKTVDGGCRDRAAIFPQLAQDRKDLSRPSDILA